MSYSSLTESALILVIDDDRLMRMQLNPFLTKENYRIVEIDNGEEGLSTFNTLRPDLVLLDAKMPVMDGFICCARLQSLSTGAHVPRCR